jgi:uncharacterized protein (UPF0335 family)
MNQVENNQISDQLKDLSKRLDKISETQDTLQKQIKMIFADITGFENLVMKVMDHYEATDEPFNKFSH